MILTGTSTRSPRGARSFLGALLAAALLAPHPAAAAREDRGPGPLPWRIGHEVGFSADVVTFPDSAGTAAEVYFRIRPTLIAELTRDGRAPEPVRIQATLRPLFGGGKSQEREQTVLVHPADTTGALGEVVVLSFPVRPGRHRLELRLEARRRQLARRGMEKPELARVEGEFVVPGPQAGREISDLEFIWNDTGHPASTVFGRSGRNLIPNPDRLYGLYATDLRAFFAARGTEARRWEWVARVLDSTGVVVGVQQGRADAATHVQSEVRIDASALPAGAYDLELKAWQEGDAGALLRRARFSVAWQPETWKQDPLDAEDQIHFLLSSDEEEDFPRMTAGEQERMMDRYWAIRDPNPDTAENEARTQYLKRVQFANRAYGIYGLGRGMFSDMGRVFIRYGEPDEVVTQVLPSLDDNITRVIYDLAATEKRSLGSVSDREPGADTRPFELWVYQGNIPLPIDATQGTGRTHVAAKRLVFLFVDQNWVGDYKLLYSSE